MTSINKSDIEQHLEKLIDPHNGTDIIAAKMVESIELEGNNATVNLTFGYPAQSQFDSFKASVVDHLSQLEGIGQITVNIKTDIVSHSVQKTLKPIPKVKNIIAVASGKGGVGKSTTSANLALALQAEGAQVGILDADIYGPSIPTMLGLYGKPNSSDGKTMEPKTAYGIQTISIGYLIDEDQPMIWRGPMVTGALQQLLQETSWDDLDYLIIDLPPGTGDIQLTLSQQIPVSGAVIVTTPQDIALLDAQRGLKMFEKVNIPVLGIIENMSTHVCSNCGHNEAIFGEGGGATMAERYDVEFLGGLPLDISIRQHADGGKPSVIAEPSSPVAQAYQEIARKMAAILALKTKDYSGKFPNIVIQNT
ncbi:MAG: iron-sulfur cluster carrier protein ApbC [Methylococcaceae bacterium]